MAATNSWMPASGKYPVDIGSSLGRALKARKGTTAPKRANLPLRDFYSFRYNFKPESIDLTKPGSIDVTKGKESTSVVVERSSSQAGEGHIFVGKEQPAKEWECVLIYDEEMGTFTLEKLDSFMILAYDRRTTSSIQQVSASPLPPSEPPGPPPPQETSRDIDFAEQLERDLLGLEDAEGEPDDELEEVIPLNIPRKEEEEEEDIFIPPKVLSPPPKAKQQPQRQPKPAAKVDVTQPKVKPSQAKGKSKAKREHETTASLDTYVEEEDLEFGRPTTKRLRLSPPSEGLALPSGSSTSLYQAPVVVPLPYSPPKEPVSDSEEDWDEVPATMPTEMAEDADGIAEDEEEIDVNAFEAEMNKHLKEDADTISPEPELASQDEDDYSSSEESDED